MAQQMAEKNFSVKEKLGNNFKHSTISFVDKIRTGKDYKI